MSRKDVQKIVLQKTFSERFDVAEVSDITGLSRETIRRRRRLGLLRGKLLGGRRYSFSISEIEKLLVAPRTRVHEVKA